MTHRRNDAGGTVEKSQFHGPFIYSLLFLLYAVVLKHTHTLIQTHTPHPDSHQLSGTVYCFSSVLIS